MGLRRSVTSFLLVYAVLPRAHAEPQEAVRVAGSCVPPGTTLDSVLGTLRGEVAPVDVSAAERPFSPHEATIVWVELDGCTSVPPTTHITVRQGSRHRDRVVDLSDVRLEARSRTLALALAETLRSGAFVRMPGAPAAIPGVLGEAQSAGLTPPASADEKRGRDAPPMAPDHPSSPAIDRADSGDGLAPRAAALVRFVPRTSSPFVGVDAGARFRRFGASLRGLATRKAESLGTVTLAAVAGTVSVDPVSFSPNLFLRIEAEAGVAFGSGAPSSSAVGHRLSGAHLALLGGLAARVPLGIAPTLELFLGGGGASSVTARVDGKDTASLSGLFVTALLGVSLW